MDRRVGRALLQSTQWRVVSYYLSRHIVNNMTKTGFLGAEITKGLMEQKTGLRDRLRQR